MEDKIGIELAINRISINYYNLEKFGKALEFNRQLTKFINSENIFICIYNLAITLRKNTKF